MAQTIVVRHGDEVSEFGLTRISREKLYGRKMKIVVDEDGNDTTTAYLTRDGSALLLKGAMAMLYVDDDYDVASRNELQAVDDDGDPLDKIDSTLGVEQECYKVEPARVLDHIAKSVYLLDPETLGDALREGLQAGGIFETEFVYRTGYNSNPVFLLKNEEGFFAIVGEPTKFEFLRKEQAPLVDDDDDDDDPFDDDDLDFGMM